MCVLCPCIYRYTCNVLYSLGFCSFGSTQTCHTPTIRWKTVESHNLNKLRSLWMYLFSGSEFSVCRREPKPCKAAGFWMHSFTDPLGCMSAPMSGAFARRARKFAGLHLTKGAAPRSSQTTMNPKRESRSFVRKTYAVPCIGKRKQLTC